MIGRWRLLLICLAVGAVVAGGAAAGAGVRATYGARTSADEPQYLLTALSLAEDGDLDVSDEIADRRYLAFHEAPLPRQTRELARGREVSPHDPLLPLLLAPAVAAGGWLGAKLLLAALAGVLAGLLVWIAVRRLSVPVAVAAAVITLLGLSPPFAVYATQVYPEVPAALAVAVAVAALTGRMRRVGVAAVALAVIALPWLAVKYAPVALVLAGLGGLRLLRERAWWRVAALAGALALAAVGYLLAHQALYGGWTPYATGDFFVGGEFTAVGARPDLLGRSTRLGGLLTDRGFGLAAWQPAWFLVVPALVALLRRGHRATAMTPGDREWKAVPRTYFHSRSGGWGVVVAPLVTGWLVATFVAVTMHGWWWPGRQVVVVLPCAALALACLAADQRWRIAVLASGAVGVAAYAWLVVEGLRGGLTWIVDFETTTFPPYRLLRLVLPDLAHPTTRDWALHAFWLVALAVLAVLATRGQATTGNDARIPRSTWAPPSTSTKLQNSR